MEVGFAPRSLVRMEQRLAVDEHGASKYKSKAEECADQNSKDKCLDSPICHWEESKEKCVVDDCESARLKSDAVCKKKDHCEWTSDKCKWVEHKECGEVKKKADCKDEGHCKWEDDACKWFGDNKKCKDMNGKEDECKLRGDCIWHGDMCKIKRDKRKCSEVTKEDACEEGMKCEWKDGVCKEEHFFKACQKHDKKSACEAKSACRWLDDACYPKADAGKKCEDFDGAEDKCKDRGNCTWNVDKCKKTECKDFSSSNKTCDDHSECIWHRDMCKNKTDERKCSEVTKEDACEEGMKCEWKDGVCKEEHFFKACQKHDKKSACEAKSACRWLDDACYPKADAGAEPHNMEEREQAREECHKLENETGCLNNPSCYWWKEGNPKCDFGLVCMQFDEDDCKELGRCKWEDKECMEANPDD